MTTPVVVVGTPFVPVSTVVPVVEIVGATDPVPDELLLPPVARPGNRLDPHGWGRPLAYVAISLWEQLVLMHCRSAELRRDWHVQLLRAVPVSLPSQKDEVGFEVAQVLTHWRAVDWARVLVARDRATRVQVAVFIVEEEVAVSVARVYVVGIRGRRRQAGVGDYCRARLSSFEECGRKSTQ